ncbi:MAG: putative Mg2+ transporter-C (MgtC) family protein [Patescibacteria group bacterium]|nr:putative Mg2+ transporter-C (MgtC) family protein [Patescibacteria group bacterium]
MVWSFSYLNKPDNYLTFFSQSLFKLNRMFGNVEVQSFHLLEALIAAGLGGVVGLERELRKKPAGFRTYMLVAASACVLINLVEVLIDEFTGDGAVSIDPMRMIEAIVVGISFIGGGVIFRKHDSEEVENITTAALILFAAILGISVALGQYVLAGGLTIFSLIVARTLKMFEEKVIH